MANVIPGIASDQAIAEEHGIPYLTPTPSKPAKSTKVKPLTTAAPKAKAKKATAKKAPARARK